MGPRSSYGTLAQVTSSLRKKHLLIRYLRYSCMLHLQYIRNIFDTRAEVLTADLKALALVLPSVAHNVFTYAYLHIESHLTRCR
jgi:hypothetical protein